MTRLINRDAIFRIERSMVQNLLTVPTIGIQQMCFNYVEDKTLSCSFATDGFNIFFNPDMIKELDEQELNTELCHQTLHFMLYHLERRENREGKRWNAACDEEVKVKINEEIEGSASYYIRSHFDYDMIKTKFKPSMTAEEIYESGVLCEKANDSHELWDQEKMKSDLLRNLAAADFDGGKVLRGEKVQIPEGLVDKFKLIEAVAQYVENKTMVTAEELKNIIEFSYSFPTILAVFLLKRTVYSLSQNTNRDGIRQLCQLNEWVKWAGVYRDYVI